MYNDIYIIYYEINYLQLFLKEREIKVKRPF